MSEMWRAATYAGIDARLHAGGAGLLSGWSRGDILTLIGVIIAAVALVVAIVPPFRRFAQRRWRALLMRAGFPRRRYARWFVNEWGVYDNPYLDATEHLDLRNTYVPLSFRAGDESQETLIAATEVLATADAGNLIIYGGPGSGKSTLMKAYGVGVLQDWVPFVRTPRIVPFYVQLRKLARFLGDEKGLADYLVEKILVAESGMSMPRAREFLTYSLRRRQVMVMLDGLDEVMSEHYESVRLAVFDFAGDHNPDRPTHLARMLLTCRRQNFLSLRDDWVPAFSRRECSLAPLRNSEIFSYLDKTRRLFKSPDGPENFMQALRASGTIDLHRIPLILAMSVGLYSRRDYFEIPSSIAELYRTMIRDMLDRHSFRRDPGGKALRFQVADKERFLREFSLRAIEWSGGFDEFSRADLVTFGESLAPHLNAVRGDPAGLVDEIIDRSGLLTDITEIGSYVFAHRSIQEYLISEQLRTTDGGEGFMLRKADDREWRQVVQFYTAGQEQRQIDGFLKDLSARNPELAAYCLAGAKASNEVAGAVLDALEPIDNVRLPAVAAATMSPREPVQEMAIERLCAAFSAPENALSAVTADVDGMLPLLNSLASTNAARIAALVPHVIAALPDDPRLVEPLWRCLTAPGIEQLPECQAIVRKLLDLVVEPNCLEELARQDRYDRNFLTEDIRSRAYPFNGGLDRSHNLITLLAWADYANVPGPARPNRFFQAKAAGQLARVESDRRHTLSFSLGWPARLLSGLELLAACIGTGYVLVVEPNRLLQAFGWWSLPLLAAAAFIPFVIFMAYALSVDNNNVKISQIDGRANTGNAFLALAEPADWMPEGVFNVCIVGIIPLAFAVSAALAAHSLTSYVVLAFFSQLLFWTTGMNVFNSDQRFYAYRPNEYVDMYEDPRSRPWLGLASPGLKLGDEVAGGGGPA